VAGGLLTLLLLLLPAYADAAKEGYFCAPEKPAFDFGLSSLPAVHELSEKEVGRELGHPSVSLSGSGWSKVMSKPERFGYGFFEENEAGPVRVDGTLPQDDRRRTPALHRPQASRSARLLTSVASKTAAAR
jgi:hypothetical protein